MSAGSPWVRTRTVVLSAKAQAFVDEHMSTAPRFRDIWEKGEGIEWFLAQNPQAGIPRGPKETAKYWLYDIAANEIAKTRPMAVLYSYDEDEVVIHSVTFTDQ